MRYTEGPWKIVKPYKFDKEQIEDRLIVGPFTQHIAEVFQFRNERNHEADGTALANARLISAAPNLLEALKICQVKVFMAYGSENEAYQKAKEAIAKAEGKP